MRSAVAISGSASERRPPRRPSTYIFGAHFVALAPHYLVSAILGGAVAREKQHKFVRNFESIEIDAHAADNEAAIRHATVPKSIVADEYYAERSAIGGSASEP